MDKPLLVFIHNHRFEENIERLAYIYGRRFSGIQHLMPFYRGTIPGVNGAWESSHYFQGYLAQNIPALVAVEASHYVFCADDLLLHPRLNEQNILSELSIGPDAAYFKSITPLAEKPLAWPHMAGALLAFPHNTGVEWERELPPREEAARRFQNHGVEVGKLGLRNGIGGIGLRQFFQVAFYFMKRWQTGRTPGSCSDLPYPLASGYSDFFVIPRASLVEFGRLCGVFAAMGVFAEVAIPTSILLSTAEVIEESATTFRGVELWSREEITALEARSDRKLDKLFASFPAEQLYVHPVKLSRWTQS